MEISYVYVIKCQIAYYLINLGVFYKIILVINKGKANYFYQGHSGYNSGSILEIFTKRFGDLCASERIFESLEATNVQAC